MDKLPERTLDTLSEAIGLSSPSGRMSKKAKEKANKRLCVALFGEKGLELPKTKQPSEKERLLRQAKQLRELAERGMKPRAYKKKAEELEIEASKL